MLNPTETEHVVNQIQIWALQQKSVVAQVFPMPCHITWLIKQTQSHMLERDDLHPNHFGTFNVPENSMTMVIEM